MKMAFKKFLFISFLILLLAPSGRATEAVFEVCPPENAVGEGELFSVTVALSENPGFATISFTLPYDRHLMECTHIKTGMLLDAGMSVVNPVAPGGALVSAISLNPISGNGILAEFYFRTRISMDFFPFFLTNVIITDFDGNAFPCTIPSLFTDIGGHWAEASIIMAVQRGIFRGFPNQTFRPDVALTRAEYVTALWNIAGSPDVKRKTPFSDIAAQSEASRKAIEWAYASGYISGSTSTTFSPDGGLTRQAAMKILFEFHGGKNGIEFLLSDFIASAFVDSDKISAWARPAMNWAIYNELLRGDSSAALNPGGAITRSQGAVILDRYLEKYESR